MVNALTGVGSGPRAYGAGSMYLGPRSIEVPNPIPNNFEHETSIPLFLKGVPLL